MTKAFLAVHKVDVPASWADAVDANPGDAEIMGRKEVVDFVKNMHDSRQCAAGR